jgi:hypothetical protein
MDAIGKNGFISTLHTVLGENRITRTAADGLGDSIRLVSPSPLVNS